MQLNDVHLSFVQDEQPKGTIQLHADLVVRHNDHCMDGMFGFEISVPSRIFFLCAESVRLDVYNSII